MTEAEPLASVLHRRARAAAQSRLDRLPTDPAGGATLDVLETMRDDAAAELEVVDEVLKDALNARRQLVAKIRRIHTAIHGTGQVGGRPVFWPPAWHPPRPPGPLRPLAGAELRQEIVTLLTSAGGDPLEVSEIAHLLALQGLTSATRPSRAIPDALRAEISSGRVERVDRGSFRAR